VIEEIVETTFIKMAKIENKKNLRNQSLKRFYRGLKIKVHYI
jgi:hypothetical protein